MLLQKTAGIVFCIPFVFPVFWTVVCSFVPEHVIEQGFLELQDGRKINFGSFLGKYSLEQYKAVLITSPDYLFRFWNSIFLVVPIVVFQLMIACLTAYGFCRVKGKLAAMLFFVYLILMMMPYQVTVIPNYLAMKEMKLLDTNWAIWLPGIFSPFSVYLLTKYMKRIPGALFEAARIDGAGETAVFFKIAMPLCRGEIVACGLLVLLDYWNMVELPLVMFSKAFSYPLSVYLSKIQEGAIGISFAAAVVYLVPILLVFLYGEEELVSGIAFFNGVNY